MKILRTLTVVAMLATPATASDEALGTVDGHIAEVTADYESLNRLYDYDPAPATLDAAFQAGGVGWARRYAGPWGGWIFVDWDRARRFHRANLRALTDWRRAIAAGRVRAEPALSILAAGMEGHRAVHDALTVWFRDDVENSVERARWLDRMQAAGCCGDAYEAYKRLADQAFADSISGDYLAIGNLRVFPPVPQGDEAVQDMRALAMDSLARRYGTVGTDRARARRIAVEAALLARAFPGEAERAGAADLLELLATFESFSQRPVAALLERAKDAEPEIREAVLADAQERLLERVGVVAPLAAASAVAGREAEDDGRHPLVAFADGARVLARLAQDVTDPMGVSSGPLRAASGLTAAAQLVAAAGGDRPDAREIVATLNNAATALSRDVPLTAAFAAPSGAVGAHLDNVASAFADATAAMDGVAAAIGGDPGGLDRARAAAERLDRTLSPKTLVASMAAGAARAIAENVPFGTELLALFGA